MTPDFNNDATLRPPPPSQTTDVPFCLDARGDAIGACETRVASLLSRVLFEQRGDCLLIRSEPVLPLTSCDGERCG